jgi:AcrR family transcriptional regulator
MSRLPAVRAAATGPSGTEPARRPLSVPPPTRDTRQFVQRRAKATYDALLEAAQHVFAERGFDDAQTPDIAREAGVSVGTFYRYFNDKKHAFLEMITAHLERSYELVMQNLTVEALGATRTAAERRATVAHVIDVLFQNAASHPRLQKVFLATAMRDPDVARIRVEFDERGRTALAAIIGEVVPRERIVDPRAAAEVIQIAAQEAAIATIGGRGSDKSKREAQALHRALSDMLYRYVFGER